MRDFHEREAIKVFGPASVFGVSPIGKLTLSRLILNLSLNNSNIKNHYSVTSQEMRSLLLCFYCQSLAGERGGERLHYVGQPLLSPPLPSATYSLKYIFRYTERGSQKKMYPIKSTVTSE